MTLNQEPSSKNTHAFSIERRAFSPEEVSEILGCSKSHIWKMVRERQLKSTKLGRRRIIAASEIARLLAGEAA